jgi:sterol desaturase/sphingolipid hydroxylase (fatty acid hydroxylase superfamily)
MSELALAALRQMLLFAALLTPLEILLPAHGAQKLLRRGIGIDLVFLALNPMVIALLVPGILIGFGSTFAWIVPTGLRETLRAQPSWAQLVEILLLGELSGYWIHRASHAVPFLWRFHSLHHSNEALDWVAAHRQHPLEAVWMTVAANLPVVALGFPTESVLGVVLAEKAYTAFLHSNVRVSLGALGAWLASPRFHHWHHAKLGMSSYNFASFLPCLDRLFGTFRLPSGFPERYGVDP